MSLPGSQLRDAIASLLRIHFSFVEVEIRIGATTADVIYVDDTQSIFPRRIAIESKDWAKPLSSKDISEIYNLYFPALSSREIDNLWIIGNHTLSSSPRATISSLKGVAYTTFSQFQSNLINLQPILQNNILSFQRDESYKYYVETRSRSGSATLISVVREWVNTEQNGLIIYGGYGLGKTTFSKYLSSRLSQEYNEGTFDRIPVRFSLGDIYHKQDLNALISSTLAGAESGVHVKNFSYDLFLEMNRLGKLLLIFDGFDEMRHAIELDDFVFNFAQMRMLLAGDAKVVILGRPDVFLSNAEELKVLSSLFENPKSASSGLALAEVGFFDSADIDQYMTAFMDSRALDEFTRARIQKMLSLVPASEGENILSRPVQLKMFTQVLDEFVDEDAVPNRYSLYETFIYKFILREQSKPARKMKSPSNFLPGRDPRARFMQNVAWWILTNKKENRFIPAELATALNRADLGGKYESEAQVREALLGSIIEPMDHSGVIGKKGNRYYYFPHKSYIEFLVAQYFSYTDFSIDMYKLFIENLSPEILSFVTEGPIVGLQNLRVGLEHATGRVARYIVEAAATDTRIEGELRSPKSTKISAINLYVYYCYLKFAGESSAFIRRQILGSGLPSRMLAAVNCAGDLLKETGDVQLARTLVLNFVTSVFDEHKLRDLVGRGTPAAVFRDEDTAVKAGALLSAVEVSEGHLYLYPDRLMDFALSSSGPSPSVELWRKGDHREISFNLAALTTSDTSATDHSTAVVSALLSKLRGPGRHLLPIQLKGEAEKHYGVVQPI